MELNAIIVPTHVCNLRCTYCYNEDERRPVMDLDTLECVVRELIAYAEEMPQFSGATFIWHGGEPSIAGLEFYRRATELQRRYRRAKSVSNCIQTNGLLLDAEWFAFLSQSNFTLSMSVDGPKDVHDHSRIDARGKGTYDRTIRKLEDAQAYGLTPGVVVTMTKANLHLVSQMYHYFARKNLGFNVVPIVHSGSAKDDFEGHAISPEEWGRALVELFDLWFKGDPFIAIDDITHATRAVMTGLPATCHDTRNCASFNIAIDPKGDVYPCGWLSGHMDLRYGNLSEKTLKVLLNERTASEFRARAAPSECQQCEWNYICYGGCRAHSYLYGNGMHGKTYFCESIKMLNSHIRKRLIESGLPVGVPVTPDPLDRLREGLQSVPPGGRKVFPISIQRSPSPH